MPEAPPDSVVSRGSCRADILGSNVLAAQPLHLLLMMFAGWVNRHQLDVIDYLQEENRLLKERLNGRRIRFTDAERRRLARKAHALGRKVLSELETLVTPDALLRWHRELVAGKWDYSARESLMGIHAHSRRARQSGT